MLVPAGQTRRYAAVGECIYCSAQDGLSDEHIIPFGLGGNLVLPEATCRSCADVTSLIERKVLRGFMYGARIVGDFPTYRKKKRPKTVLTKLIHADDSTTEYELPVEAAPGFLILPTFARATILDGRPATKGVLIKGQETIHFGAAVDEVVKKHGARGIEFTSDIEATEFAQMLAKIAYSHVVAELGLFPRDETPLLRLIAGQADDGGSWIGSHTYTLNIEKQRPQHALAITSCANSQGAQGLLAHIKLFASAGATGYEVAARIPNWHHYSADAWVR